MDTVPSTVTTQTASSDQSSLQDRIQTLTLVHDRLQSLRHVPTLLLRPPSGSPLAGFPPPFDPAIDREFAATFNSTPTHDFRALKDFAETISSDKVQEALRAARASEDADQSELGLCFRRETRNANDHSRPSGLHNPTVPSPPRSLSLLPPFEDDPPPLRAESLVEFVREFNRGNGGGINFEPRQETEGVSTRCKLAIWSRTQSSREKVKTTLSGAWQSHVEGGSPVVLRFIIPDVLTAYISLIHTNVESATDRGECDRIWTEGKAHYEDDIDASAGVCSNSDGG
ncbi:hypothetical protein JVU11DRAFT_2485 [Chiua virens]|nr:hypothetical protein JVU11DRAFT_2485 [Chiua virens]